jgi:vitamin B12 transporter
LKTLFILACNFLGILGLRAGSGDSVSVFHLKEVQVIGSRFDYFTEGQQQFSVSPLVLNFNKCASLGELLAQTGQLYIKSYGGAGALSTLSIRGANSNQTQVNWNGFPLNSVTTGDADLSLIPCYMIDELSIHPGASGSLYGSGTFGGSVDLVNRSQCNTPFTIFFDSEIGSFHNRAISAGFSQGLRKIGYSFSFALRNALNDFSYTDIYKPGDPKANMTHNSLKYMGIFQNLFYSPDAHNKLELGIWYQQKMKDLPQIMGSYGPSFASQKDSSLKIFAKWTRLFTHSAFTFKSAYFTDYLNFLDKITPSDPDFSINSKIYSRQILSDLSFRNFFSEHFSGEIGVVSKLIYAEVAAYSHDIFEPRTSAYSAAKLSYMAFNINLSVRTEMTKGEQPKPVIAGGINYNLIKNILTLRLASSTKYRLPSLNEKYWQPGGNPNILPEEGWTNEAGFICNLIKGTPSVLTFESQAYSSRMKNLIQWTGSGNELEPVNFKSVWSRGVDGQIRYNYTGRIIQFESAIGVEHLKSTNTDTYEGDEAILGKQLRYTPQNRMNYFSQIDYSTFKIGYILSFTGSTFINEDNSGMILPAFSVSHIYASVSKEIYGNNCELNVRISNIFNNHYQVIAAYPAQGRAYNIGISIRFNTIKKNKNAL